MRSSSFASGSSLASLVLLAALSGAGCTGEDTPEPACADPAPLEGTFDSRAPGYIVTFHGDVDTELESDRLATQYDFEVTSLYTAALRGFAADFDADVRAQLRCEASVASVTYNGVVSTD